LLQRHRLTAGLSQEVLAERAGLSKRGISDLERGLRQAPYLATIRRLAEALDLPEPERAMLLAASRRAGAPTAEPTATEPPAPHRPGHNLPHQLTSFIGRDRDFAELRRLLGCSPLLTLTGPGRVGKTRLALHVAEAVLPEYADGAWLVELAAPPDPQLVPQTVAAALGITEQPGRALIQVLAERLGPKHLLLVLDNCEHWSRPAPSLRTACCVPAPSCASWRPAASPCASRARRPGAWNRSTYRRRRPPSSRWLKPRRCACSSSAPARSCPPSP
jgi:transcriptional regulator with XRE-family HTH domain